jgi:hypothetical protein
VPLVPRIGEQIEPRNIVPADERYGTITLQGGALNRGKNVAAYLPPRDVGRGG